MSCYKPNVLYDTGVADKYGKHKYVFKKYAKELEDEIVNGQAYNCVKIPCGKCLGCRLDYSRHWADRMMLELESNDGKGMFLTLTYNDECIPMKFDENDVPLGATVDVRDCQLFMKNLRKQFDGKCGRTEKKIRFFASSEYGPVYKRPHLHIIVFGLAPSDFPSCEVVGYTDLGYPKYRIPEIEYAWQEFEGKGRARHPVRSKGYVTIEDVTYNSAAYVARYTLKKAMEGKDDYALASDLVPEFSLMSRRPGIGFKYIKEHPDCLDLVSVPLPAADGVKKVSIPKYFLRASLEADLISQEKYDKMMEQRKQLAIDKQLQQLSRTSLFYLDQLEIEEKERLARVSALSRIEVE